MTLAAAISELMTSFSLIGMAEMGDKSQIVCMTLAMRHRGMPILLGAVAAFAILNLLAVFFGAAIAHWVPQDVIVILVSGLFILFGLQALMQADSAQSEAVDEPKGHSLFVSALLLIFLAELGDKTQIAVAGLASTLSPVWVWLGATAALTCTTGLGIWAGRTLLQRVSGLWVSRISGTIFLLFAVATLGLHFS